MIMNADLGDFSFSFQFNGKLEKLAIADGPNLLYESTRPVEMTPGRFYTPAGWDECFPTIEPAVNSPFMGDLVGLAPVIETGPDRIRQTWKARRFHASRTFRLEDACTLRVDFTALNVSGEALDVLWANHALLGVERLKQVILPDGDVLRDFAMDGSERKWFLPADGPVVLGYDGFVVTMTTDQPWWGIWWDKGGWPVESPGVYNCLGVEATNTPGEVPAGQRLGAGEHFDGWVRLAVN